jgi:hypothetical protein
MPEKTHKETQSSGRGFNPGPAEYKTGMLTNRSQRLLKVVVESAG